MRKIINGLIYDTETAECLLDISPQGFSRGDFQWEDTRLYRSPNGMFFIAGEGNAKSRWAKHFGQSEHGPGSGLRVVDEIEARAFVEQDGSVERYVEIFGEPGEG